VKTKQLSFFLKKKTKNKLGSKVPKSQKVTKKKQSHENQKNTE